jgi:ribose transport system substrate-binding protein
MVHKTKTLGMAAALLGLMAALAGCNHTTETGSGTTTPSVMPAGKSLRIAVIPKGTTHEYWKSIHAGAVKAQQELASKGTAVEILWKGPAREDDRNAQIDVVQTFLSQKVDGIVLAPLDSQALVSPVADAAKQKIPVVIMDSGLNSTDYTSFVATDNKKGGLLAGQQLAKVLGGKGKVIMIRYQQGSASTEQREAGFLDAMKAAPGITLISSDQFAGPTVDTAYKSSQNVLSRFGSQVNGIFMPNESSTRGMLLALKDAGLLGKVKFVGFDSSADLIAALKANQLQALVVQNPFNMGYLSLLTVVSAIKGEKVDKTIDTGVTLVTPENMNTPEIQTLLSPPIDQYLK